MKKSLTHKNGTGDGILIINRYTANPLSGDYVDSRDDTITVVAGSDALNASNGCDSVNGGAGNDLI